jgi:predicted phosphodiesterase
MRLALLSDIHGNSIAFDAVLRDVDEQGGVDGYWALGDFAAIGFDPAGVIRRATGLANARFVHGNTDRYVVSDDLPAQALDAARRDAASLERIVELVRSLAWTRGYVTATGQLDWLAELPMEQRLTLPDGTRLLGVHAAPGTDDGPGIQPGLTDSELGQILRSADAELVVVGHTHVPLDRTVDGRRAFNLGSVSNPVGDDLRASYAILDADSTGCSIRRRRVSYDVDAVIAAIERVRHPAASFVLDRFRRRGVGA